MGRVKTLEQTKKWFSRYERFYSVLRAMPDNSTVLEVGMNDGKTCDPIGQVWCPTWSGLFIEPNAMMLSRAKTTGRRGLYLCVAIGESNAKLTLYSMTRECAEAYLKERGDDGSCLTSSDREHIRCRLKKYLPALWAKYGENCIESTEVDALTLDSLLTSEKVSHIDIVQIDVEGMDAGIALQVLRSKVIKPKVIMWEHRHVFEDEQALAVNEFKRLGYVVDILLNDTLAVRR